MIAQLLRKFDLGRSPTSDNYAVQNCSWKGPRKHIESPIRPSEIRTKSISKVGFYEKHDPDILLILPLIFTG